MWWGAGGLVFRRLALIGSHDGLSTFIVVGCIESGAKCTEEQGLRGRGCVHDPKMEDQEYISDSDKEYGYQDTYKKGIPDAPFASVDSDEHI